MVNHLGGSECCRINKGLFNFTNQLAPSSHKAHNYMLMKSQTTKLVLNFKIYFYKLIPTTFIDRKVKYFSSFIGHRVALISVSLALGLTQAEATRI